MTMIRKAQRKKAKLRLGISAPPGAGKTMGSLLLAYGMMKQEYPDLPDAALWDKIALIDTEEGSGELYVGKQKHGITIGEYGYIRISAPFTVPKYLEAIKVAEASNIEVICLDSISHAWAGTGGLLDKQGKLADASKNSYTAWRFVTPEHTAFIDAMLQSKAHIIATMRSKVEYVLEENEKGQMVPRKKGMAPVQREGMEYEFTAVFDIDFDSIAYATKDRTDLFSQVDGAGRLEKRRFMITPQTGRELMVWLNSGVDVPTIEALADAMAAAVLECTDVQATVEQYAETFSRLQKERPVIFGEMNDLLDARYLELNPPETTVSAEAPAADPV